MLSMRSSLLALSLGFVTVGVVGCYTIDFDEALSDVYYCLDSSECGDSQACWQFRCVDDRGPQVEITGPEPLQNLAFGSTTITANYNITDFTISDSNESVEGQGKVEVSIDGTDLSAISVIAGGAELDISSLTPGAYRLRARAVRGDETPYENPSASAYTVFYVEDQDPTRPQIAIVWPTPNHVHILGEPLDVVVAARNFTFDETGTDCRIDDGCDPWANPDAPECMFTCDLDPNGHTHVYLLDNYPECLTASPSCNGDYALSLRTAESTATQAVATIPEDRFTEAGTFTFTAALQYNDHLPYPNTDFVFFDQITIEVAPRN